jgi:hypothetical protein
LVVQLGQCDGISLIARRRGGLGRLGRYERRRFTRLRHRAVEPGAEVVAGSDQPQGVPLCRKTLVHGLVPGIPDGVEPGVHPLVDHGLVEQHLQPLVLGILISRDPDAKRGDQRRHQLFTELAGLDHRCVGVGEHHRLGRSTVPDLHGFVGQQAPEVRRALRQLLQPQIDHHRSPPVPGTSRDVNIGRGTTEQ